MIYNIFIMTRSNWRVNDYLFQKSTTNLLLGIRTEKYIVVNCNANRI